MNTISLQINDKKVSVPKGSTILDAAKKAEVSIPTLCHLEHREPLGACRLCLVEVKGARSLVTACSTAVAGRKTGDGNRCQHSSAGTGFR